MILSNSIPSHFWHWFSAHANALSARAAAAVTGAQPLSYRVLKAYFGDLIDATRGFDAELTPMLGRDADGVLTLTFTADAAAEAFGAARQLLEAAPSVPGWRFAAFAGRRIAPDRIAGDAVALDTAELRFAYALANNRIVVMLLTEQDISCDYFEAQYLARRIVHDLLGEEDFGLHVAGAQIGNYQSWLAATPGGQSWPVGELAARFDRIFKRQQPGKPALDVIKAA